MRFVGGGDAPAIGKTFKWLVATTSGILNGLRFWHRSQFVVALYRSQFTGKKQRFDRFWEAR